MHDSGEKGKFKQEYFQKNESIYGGCRKLMVNGGVSMKDEEHIVTSKELFPVLS